MEMTLSNSSWFSTDSGSASLHLWIGLRPVILDALMLEKLNAARKKNGFDPISEDDARMLDFAQQLGVGSTDTAHVTWQHSGTGSP